jgi:hypothetical protein
VRTEQVPQALGSMAGGLNQQIREFKAVIYLRLSALFNDL